MANIAVWQTEEAFDSILGATFNLLNATSETPSLQKFVYISSSMIFGDFKPVPMPEDGPKEHKDIYGGMKLSGEVLTKVFNRRYKWPYVLIRPSALYGLTENIRRVLQIFSKTPTNRWK